MVGERKSGENKKMKRRKSRSAKKSKLFTKS